MSQQKFEDALVHFLEQKKRGIYNLVIGHYKEVILRSPNITIAKALIEMQISEATGKLVSLNYNSFAHALKRLKLKPKIEVLKIGLPTNSQYDFRDLNIESRGTNRPGQF